MRLELAAVHRLLDEKRPAAALTAMLEAWRARRLPRLADLIDELSEHLTGALPPVVGRTRKALQEAWLDLATARRDLDVDRLLDVFPEPPWVHVGERIERLQSLDDPRVARAFADFVSTLPTAGGIGGSRWTMMLSALARMKDARVREPLARRVAQDDARVLMFQTVLPGVRRVLEELPADDATTEELAALKELSGRLEALLREPPPSAESLFHEHLAARREGPREDELLALIYEVPEDDGPRLVYADWLHEHGSPRAELLALQFKKQPLKRDLARARELVKAHGRTWLGALEPAVALRSEVFERGFLAECHVVLRTPKQAKELTGHPAWNTVTRLQATAGVDFLLGTELRGLEALSFVPLDLAVRLSRRDKPLRRLAELSVYCQGVEELPALTRDALPVLSSLMISSNRPVDWTELRPQLVDPLWSQLTRLGLRGAGASALLAFATLPKLTELRVAGPVTVILLREADGEWVLDLEPQGWIQAGMTEEAVRGLLPAVRRVRRTHPGWLKPELVLSALESLRRRFPFEWVDRPPS
ncbi:MAG: TIGR02996 domain-containing protein [Myxococcales bacterium]|nr:TIGR02996 domain-containing protein [Myxococcales bacterium]